MAVNQRVEAEGMTWKVWKAMTYSKKKRAKAMEETEGGSRSQSTESRGE